MIFEKITEMSSPYRHIEKMSIIEILQNINQEDVKVPLAIKKEIPQIKEMVGVIIKKVSEGGRLFYIGAGTSGRLGVLDAIECPPTYGVSENLVIGVIAGGDRALREGIEDAEDDEKQGWIDLQRYNINSKDIVIGIAASGTTPYVMGALKKSQENRIITGCIVCNKNSPIAQWAKYPVEVIVGPEFVTGSTRMKSGTAQKLVLNMISTSVMIRLGKVHDNKMINMQIDNEKLMDRGVKILMEEMNLFDYETAKNALLKYGSVKSALDAMK